MIDDDHDDEGTIEAATADLSGALLPVTDLEGNVIGTTTRGALAWAQARRTHDHRLGGGDDEHDEPAT